ncbi:hypothetical protein BDQ17DRAFT_1244307, partial [Cyathus striatus]
KWQRINHILRENNIGIISIQETHLREVDELKLNDQFREHICIINSTNPSTPNAAGVAFILHKRNSAWKDAEAIEVQPGRALLLTIQWQKNGALLRILNVYSPNLIPDQIDFWKKIDSMIESHEIPKPDVILGDFNMVEECAD